MRKVLRENLWLMFLFYAVFFGGFTQLANVVLFGEGFSPLAGVFGGLVFATGMTAVELRRRKREAAGSS